MLIDTSSGTVLLGRLEAAGIPLESVRHLFLSHRHVGRQRSPARHPGVPS
jgi:metal-dependent hydrolase (beta-lactamase superfamily II)